MEVSLTTETLQLSVLADLANLAGIRSFVRTSLVPFCMDEDFLYDLSLAVEEAVTNIILHGYDGKAGEITIMIHPNAGSTEIILRDDAPPFDPTVVPAPRLDLPLDQRPLGGLGVHLMRKNLDSLSYRRTPAGSNELKLVKIYPAP